MNCGSSLEPQLTGRENGGGVPFKAGGEECKRMEKEVMKRKDRWVTEKLLRYRLIYI